LFQETLRKAGLNKYLFEMANIRDQCSWVHQADPGIATEKAKDLVRMAVARSHLLEPLYEIPFDVVQKGLVIGGGLAGMTAALRRGRRAGAGANAAHPRMVRVPLSVSPVSTA
jgi:heterodisulfide reductase subunit A-like polyferredoxin